MVLLGGCDRGEPSYEGTISGQVVSVLDRSLPIPFAKVVMYLDDYCTLDYHPECWIPLDSTIADENGNFAIDYAFEDEYPRLVVKGYLDGYFIKSAPIFTVGPTDTIQVSMTPKTYFKVHIEDEYPYDYSKYVGMQVYNTSLLPIDTIFQYPLDTTVVIEGNPQPFSDGTPRGMAYSLVYDRPNTIGSSNYLPMDFCPPFDTCGVWIKF